MTRGLFLKITLLIALLVLAACAPDNLDITPSPTPTPAPTATSTPDPAAVATEETAADAGAETAAGGNRALLDHIVENVPQSISAGQIQWRRTEDEISGEPVTYKSEEGGETAKVYYSEAGGGYSELTFGVFDAPEAATTFYEIVRGRLRTLENAEERDVVPSPNAFGGGTYGSDAIWVQDNIYTRVSIPRFSSTAGEPLSPYSRAVQAIVLGALESYSG
jgi:hypothetical protein